ncbi:MAG: winged helix-turn-helix transcriptional regulator [Spirosomataceae bacterium]
MSGKYKGRILWILRDGFLRYRELKRAVVGIIPKMLTQKVEYSLTDTGKELIPFISLMRTWGEKQMSAS